MTTSTLQGYFNTDWTKQYLDSDGVPLNNNNSDTLPYPNPGFNSFVSTTVIGGTSTGTSYVIGIYDTSGNQVTYVDSVNNVYYLCASVTVTSPTPTPSGKSSNIFACTSTNTTTFFGQYYGGGNGAPNPPAISSQSNFINNGNYYNIWVNTGSDIIPIGNPTFTATISINNETNINSCSAYLTDVNTAYGIYVPTPSNATITNPTWQSTVNFGIGSYSVSAIYSSSTGNISSTDTNIFTDKNNTSLTITELTKAIPATETTPEIPATYGPVTYHDDYLNNNRYQKVYGSDLAPVTAGYAKLAIFITNA